MSVDVEWVNKAYSLVIAFYEGESKESLMALVEMINQYIDEDLYVPGT